jgi:DNA-directed RNA polymerase subunit RPC12/RpoP
VGVVEPINRTLEQELFALLRGASLECPACGEFVLHEGEWIACPECGSRLERRAVEQRGKVRLSAG